jgi:hypothetical protein
MMKCKAKYVKSDTICVVTGGVVTKKNMFFVVSPRVLKPHMDQ